MWTQRMQQVFRPSSARMNRAALPNFPGPSCAAKPLRWRFICVPRACNRATADFLLASPLIGEDYRPAASPGDLAPDERDIADIGLALRS